MNKKLLFKILKHINKKCCDNKLQINKIILFESKEVSPYGWYFLDKKAIFIRKNIPLIHKVAVLVHEIAHAYYHQILMDKKGRHNKRFKQICKRFVKEINFSELREVKCLN